MQRNYRTLTHTDRIKIETLLNAGKKVKEIADLLNFNRSTIYREIKRGQYIHRNSDYTEEVRYSSDLAEEKHIQAQKAKGKELKIGTNIKLANRLEQLIIKEKYSPAAALANIRQSGEFDITISIRTLYRYIDNGLFFELSNKNLPIKGKKHKKHHKHRQQKRASAGTSIESRPEEVLKREEFGFWEMDTVKGKKGVTKSCLLVLTERKTRYEFIYKLPDQGAAAVVCALDDLEKRFKNNFSKVFKSITVDNGVEFSDFEGLERSALYENKRTRVYYCHAYCSWERGSNENNNRLVRRHIPKGVDFDKISKKEVKQIESWMNHYPREIFNFGCAEQEYEKNITNLLQNA